MISLDIVNLFTNIPLNYTLNIIKNKLEQDNNLIVRTKLPVHEIISLLNFCMHNNSFSFNGKYFKQKFGAPMGCNLSPIIAEALVSYIFEKAMLTTHFIPKFIRFFVDDSFLIINKNYVDNFFYHINNFDNELKSIQFTIEIEKDNQISFLDTLVSKNNGLIKTTVYRKPTHSNRYLNFRSNHSLINKKSVIRALVSRAFTHNTDQSDLKIELSHIEDVLIENNYPKNLIHEIISQQKQKHLLPKVPSSHLTPSFDITKTISIPYYKHISENIKKILFKYDIKVVFKRGLTVRNMLNNNKRNKLDKAGLVYKINCNECDAIYVGETKRKLITRLTEHKNAISNINIKSNIADHAHNTQHNINFDNIHVSYYEKKYLARKFLESFEIEKLKQLNSNLMNDQQNSKTIIPNIYLSLLQN
jgi:hypothetical protein